MLPALALYVSACASIGFISHFLRKAPEGWEDNGGFHFGSAPTVRRNRLVVAAPNAQLFRVKRRAVELASAAYH
jgi:hypothetical protein